MSDVGVRIPTPPELAVNVHKPRGLQPNADFLRTIRGHILQEGEDWRDACRPEYWSNVLSRLQPGDRIEVHSHDHSVQLNVIVFAANDKGIQRLDCGFTAIWPPDLELPGPIMREERYRAKYNGNLWQVQHLASGEVLAEFGHQAQAREAIAALETQDFRSEVEREEAAAPAQRPGMNSAPRASHGTRVAAHPSEAQEPKDWAAEIAAAEAAQQRERRR
jgi:hypothetical protein